jgi:hypothetical protein
LLFQQSSCKDSTYQVVFFSTHLFNSTRTHEKHLVRTTTTRLATVDDSPRDHHHEPHSDYLPCYHWGWSWSTTWLRHVLSLPEQGWHDRIREGTPRSRCWSRFQPASIHGRSPREEPERYHDKDTLVAFLEDDGDSGEPQRPKTPALSTAVTRLATLDRHQAVERMTRSPDTRLAEIGVLPATSGAHIMTIECTTWLLCHSKSTTLYRCRLQQVFLSIITVRITRLPARTNVKDIDP